MKKTLIALAALAATGAFAQSTVTLSGTMDVGFENVTGAASQLQSSRNGTTNITFAGTEDLGGGLKANFLVSTAFDSTFDDAGKSLIQKDATLPAAAGAANPQAGTGAGTTGIGNNNMYVGLSGGFGEIRAGRPVTTLWANGLTANGTKGVSGFAASTSLNGVVYAANTVQYISPKVMGGLTAQLEYNAAEVDGVKNGTTIGLKYENGPLALTATRADFKGISAVAGSDDNSAKVMQLAASYDLNVVKVFVTAQSDDAKAAGNKNSNVIGLTAPVGAGMVWASLGTQESSAAAGNKTITGVGYKHNLSKRTQAYINYGTRNDAAAAGAGTTGYGLGLTHNF